MVGYFLQGKSRLQKKKLDNIFFPKQRYVEGDEKKKRKRKERKVISKTKIWSTLKRDWNDAVASIVVNSNSSPLLSARCGGGGSERRGVG